MKRTRAAVLTLITCVVLVPPAVSNQPETRPSGDGRISGRVLTESGDGLADAEVFALLMTNQPQATASYSAITSPDGGYLIERIPPGQYRVYAEKWGYSNLLVQSGRIEGVRTVDVEASGAATGIDVVLRPAGSVAGRVTRPDGTPVQRARVVTEVRLANDRMVGAGPGAVTDADGRYRLDGVPPGTYVVTAIYSVMHEMLGKAVPDEYQDWARTFHVATSDVERAAPVAIRGGDHHNNIDIVLQPVPRYRVSGVIVGDNESPLRNVRLAYASAAGTAGTITKVAEDGRFTVGGMSGLVTLLGTADTDSGPHIGLMQLNVASSIDGVRLSLGPPARVRGRVIFDGTRPALQEPLQVQLATDWLRPRTNAEAADMATIGPDGQFAIETAIGERRVMVLRLMPQWEVKEVRRGGRVVADRRLMLSAGEVVNDLEIVIAQRP